MLLETVVFLMNDKLYNTKVVVVLDDDGDERKRKPLTRTCERKESIFICFTVRPYILPGLFYTLRACRMKKNEHYAPLKKVALASFLSSVLVGAMLEQQDSNYSGESGGVGANVFPLLINGCKPDTDETGDASASRSESVDLLEKVGGDEIGGERERRSESRDSINSVKGQLGQDGGESDDLSTATTTVRIHTTYKKRASKFMNRPNVQNGLGANPLLNPYGSGGSIHSAGLGGNSGGRIFGGSNYNGNNSTGGNYNSAGTNNVNPDNSFSTGASRSRHYKRSFTTRNSVHGGSNSSGGGTTSPNNNGPSSTTASSSTATTVESRPPFVTTVTRGRFLPSKFDLMVEKSLFTFSSRPKPVGLITKHHCSLSGPLRDSNSQNSQ